MISIDSFQAGSPNDIQLAQVFFLQKLIQIFCQRVLAEIFLIVYEKALQSSPEAWRKSSFNSSVLFGMMLPSYEI